MTRLFATTSKRYDDDDDEGYEEEEYEEDDDEDEEEWEEMECVSGPDGGSGSRPDGRKQQQQQQQRFSLLTALRKSLVTCAVDLREAVHSPLDIGRPTEVRHVAHVTFDRFNGFLGLPVELQTEIPVKVPSASASVFGVSADSMQCSHDHRGNSVPIVLLLLQNRLYSQGGLQVEGIFRISGENCQELHVRDQLNKGIVPEVVDSYCLASLIKAWFRELPNGILDCVTPDQVIHCTNEKECSSLVNLLPPTEAALLDWAINLMADVVQYESENKMNARNIAMVFAPNMSQMYDPLTALTHAVRVMNLLKILILKTLRERNAAATKASALTSSIESSSDIEGKNSKAASNKHCGWITDERSSSINIFDRGTLGDFTISEQISHSDLEESFHSFSEKSDADEELTFISQNCSPIDSHISAEGDRHDGAGKDCLFDRFNIRQTVRKLCQHPVFQLSKSSRKRDIGKVNSMKEGKLLEHEIG